MSDAIFTSDLLNQYQLIIKPGVHLVRVAYSVSHKNLIYSDEHPRLLVPLRVLTGEGVSELVGILDKTPRVPFKQIRHLFLTGAIFEESLDPTQLPVKGEKVVATFDYIQDKRLVCTNIEQLPREELQFLRAEELIKFNSKILKLIEMRK